MRGLVPSRGFRVPPSSSSGTKSGRTAPCTSVRRRPSPKIAANLPKLDATRFNLKFAMSQMRQREILEAIELYGTKVVPRVRELITEQRDADG